MVVFSNSFRNFLTAVIAVYSEVVDGKHRLITQQRGSQLGGLGVLQPNEWPQSDRR